MMVLVTKRLCTKCETQSSRRVRIGGGIGDGRGRNVLCCAHESWAMMHLAISNAYLMKVGSVIVKLGGFW